MVNRWHEHAASSRRSLDHHRTTPATGTAQTEGGRVLDRAALTGILFVLRSGIPWELLPQEMGRGSGVTCWRGLRDWQDAGVWNR